MPAAGLDRGGGLANERASATPKWVPHRLPQLVADRWDAPRSMSGQPPRRCPGGLSDVSRSYHGGLVHSFHKCPLHPGWRAG
jgi:hypothetical protein